jgi:hypothetical protein
MGMERPESDKKATSNGYTTPLHSLATVLT